MTATRARRMPWVVLLALLPFAVHARAQPKPVPRTQATPLPADQVAFEHDGVELARLHLSPAQRRPFVFPLRGPKSGRPLTRMGHPHDPVGHSHHNSVWIAHQDVDGVNFWEDHGKTAGRIVPQRVEKLADGDSEASCRLLSHWQDAAGVTKLLERRRVAVRPLEGGDWMLILDLELAAPADKSVTLGKTPFGLVGVRVAKSLGPHDGGGTIRNSEGSVGEKGDAGVGAPPVFRQKARWCDISGPTAPGVDGQAPLIEGLTLLDHPDNPGHPTPFHVRDDGWMGACVSHEQARIIEPGKPMRLRYGIMAHGGMPTRDQLDAVWRRFAAESPAQAWKDERAR